MTISVNSRKSEPKLDDVKHSEDAKAFFAKKLPGAMLYIDKNHKSGGPKSSQPVNQDLFITILNKKMDENGLGDSPKTGVAYLCEGTRESLIAKGTGLLAALCEQSELPNFNWQLTFIEIFLPDPIRNFFCDAEYDLAHGKGKTYLAWVKVYPGADWRESQKYPTTEFIHTKYTDPSLINLKLGSQV
jgi:hypothetical protein